MANGYFEKMLRVNLTTGEMKVEVLDKELARSSLAVVVSAPRSCTMKALQLASPCPQTTSSST